MTAKNNINDCTCKYNKNDVNKCSDNNSYAADRYNVYDNDKICIAKLQVSPDKCYVVFTTKNMLRLLGYKQPIMCLDSTYCCLWNHQPFHICGIMDKHHHFHPNCYIFGSNEDTDSYTYFFEALRNMHVAQRFKKVRIGVSIFIRPEHVANRMKMMMFIHNTAYMKRPTVP